MPDAASPPSFDDIAVALKLAASKLRLDLEQVQMLGARFEMSNMGIMLAEAELQRNLDLLAHAHHFFKDNAGVENEMRAVAHKKRGGLMSLLTRAAVL